MDTAFAVATIGIEWLPCVEIPDRLLIGTVAATFVVVFLLAE